MAAGYFAEDTIAALATGPGGAVAMIRISGTSALQSLQSLTAVKDADAFPAGQLKRAAILDENASRLDDALVVFFRGPRSFTGEDVVELHLHASPYITARVLERLQGLGARQALPGEFSFRAVRNGKLSLSQAEALPDLIGASNEDAVRLALEKLSGTQNRLVGEIGGELRDLAMQAEAGIDFSDQDIEELGIGHLVGKLKGVRERLLRLEQSYQRGSKLQEGVRVALLGLPNAGKSSFFNAVLGEERSIVSEIEGTTRDVVGERLTLQGAHGSMTFRLEDTAGVRDSADRIENLGVERSRRSAREADLVILVADPTLDPAESIAIWQDLGADERTLAVVTKADLADEQAIQSVQMALRDRGVGHVVRTSAVTGEGITQAAEAMVEMARRPAARAPGEVLLTRLDHVRAVTEARSHLDRASQSSELELFAADIRQALNSLQPLIGETLADDILGKIFSEFCIGK